MFHIILFQPQIPQNTGNIGRLCAITQMRLHLVHPLGFTITDKHLKRSGMDYWHALDLHHHDSWEDFVKSPQGPRRTFLLTTKAEKPYWDLRFEDGDGFLFGNEGTGAPSYVHSWAGNNRVTIPHYNEDLRSLNLATSAGIVAYEALRQTSLQPASI